MRKMVREDILGGLKVALSKGHSLQQAMQSFYNAGYSKEEIEEAVRYLQSNQYSETSQPSTQLKKPISQQPASKPILQKETEVMPLIPKPDQGLSLQEDQKDENEITETKQSALYKPLPTQRISNYGEEKVHRRNTGKIILIILLFIILFALIGGLVALFLYKGQVLSWFGM